MSYFVTFSILTTIGTFIAKGVFGLEVPKVGKIQPPVCSIVDVLGVCPASAGRSGRRIGVLTVFLTFRIFRITYWIATSNRQKRSNYQCRKFGIRLSLPFPTYFCNLRLCLIESLYYSSPIVRWLDTHSGAIPCFRRIFLIFLTCFLAFLCPDRIMLTYDLVIPTVLANSLADTLTNL